MDPAKLAIAARRSGRTQRMIDELIKAVQEGQPLSVVVVADSYHAIDMRNHVLKSLSEAGINPLISGIRGMKLTWITQEIHIVPYREMYAWSQGRQGYGEFWDHHTLEVQAQQ